MKVCCILLVTVLLLTGCQGAMPSETVSDELLIAVDAPMAEVVVALPENAAEQTMVGENGDRLYFCDGYSLCVQTLKGGDLSASLRSLCGYGPEKISPVKTVSGDLKRYDWVWVSTSEDGDQMCRAVLLDDGAYHYCVSVMADAAQAGALEEQWNSVFDSVSLAGQSS